MIAMLIQFASPLAFAIILAQLAVQIARTVYEERVLAETFPEYASYQARTDPKAGQPRPRVLARPTSASLDVRGGTPLGFIQSNG